MKAKDSERPQLNRLKWSAFFWTLLPLLLWWGGIRSREQVIQPYCVDQPAQCSAANLLPMDRPAVGLEVPGADSLSFTTQGLSGVWALSVPPLWHAATIFMRQATPVGAFTAAATDLVILIQTTAWNGTFTEAARLVTHRPRPFVFADPGRAANYSNYTSFYSGHTSFAAAATVFVFLALVGWRAPTWLIALSGVVSYGLTSLTGLYRVLAGRHFPTDVLIGALAGIAVAVAVAYCHRRLRS